jgi:hypothetical protein
VLLNHGPGDPPVTREIIGHGPRYFRIESELASDVEMIDKSYLSGLERGVRNPSWTVIGKFAAALGTTPAKLAARAERRR